MMLRNLKIHLYIYVIVKSILGEIENFYYIPVIRYMIFKFVLNIVNYVIFLNC